MPTLSPSSDARPVTALRARRLLAAALFAFFAVPAAHAGDTAKVEAQQETGMATYYSERFEGRRTASGQTFRHSELIAAHAFHPFGTIVRVTNLGNGSSVDVRIADRGGFGRHGGKLIIDLSRTAASQLDMLAGGRARVLVEVLGRTGQRIKAAAEAAQFASEPAHLAAATD